jgi:small-conductance mechanosensitive channel
MSTSPTPQATPPPPSGPSLQNLPPGLTADAIDVLPVLSSLLSRLQVPQNQTSASTAGSPPGPTSSATPSQLASGTTPLTIKDIPAATDQVKHRLQRARVSVKELPDLDRSLAEQEEEIRELKEKIQRQKDVLKNLAKGDIGAGESNVMEGIKEG